MSWNYKFSISPSVPKHSLIGLAGWLLPAMLETVVERDNRLSFYGNEDSDFETKYDQDLAERIEAAMDDDPYKKIMVELVDGLEIGDAIDFYDIRDELVLEDVLKSILVQSDGAIRNFAVDGENWGSFITADGIVNTSIGSWLLEQVEANAMIKMIRERMKRKCLRPRRMPSNNVACSRSDANARGLHRTV